MPIELLLKKLENFLNQSIQQDENALDSLQLLAGKNLVLSIDNLTKIYRVTFYKQHIELESCNNDLSNDISLYVSAPLKAYITLLVTRDPLHAKQLGLDFSGNAEDMSQIQSLFFKLDIDWEEHLSLFTGDIAANEIGKLFSKTRTELNEFTTNLNEMISEYILEEKKVCPSENEVNIFLKDIDELRSQVDRLDARKTLLTSSLEDN